MRRSVVSLLVALAICLVLAAPATASTSTGNGSWVWQDPLPAGEPLGDLCFISGTEGWALAPYSRSVIHTSDAGASWHAAAAGAPVAAPSSPH